MLTPPRPKSTWTDDDFDAMGWHDNPIHALSLDAPVHDGSQGLQLLLDIDYIVSWVHPEEKDGYFRFWMCPATLAFHDVAALQANKDADIGGLETLLTIAGIQRSEPNERSQRTWTIEGHNFYVSFVASGFAQYLRADPILSDSQVLDRAERGEPTFHFG